MQNGDESNQENNTPNDDDGNDPSAPDYKIIIASNDTISLSRNSSTLSITYSIINPIEGLSVEASANVDWIHSFKINSDKNKVNFTTDASSSLTERTGIITLTYGESTATVTVIQTGEVKLEEVAITAPYILGHYYGNYADLNLNKYSYYIVLSESDYTSDKMFNAEGWKYFIDVYSDVRPADYSHIRVPNGVYTLNSDNDGRVGTFMSSYSLYKEYDANGVEINQRTYDNGVLTVTDDLVQLEVSFKDGTDLHIVSYSGDYSIVDYRSTSGGTE